MHTQGTKGRFAALPPGGVTAEGEQLAESDPQQLVVEAHPRGRDAFACRALARALEARGVDDALRIHQAATAQRRCGPSTAS